MLAQQELNNIQGAGDPHQKFGFLIPKCLLTYSYAFVVKRVQFDETQIWSPIMSGNTFHFDLSETYSSTFCSEGLEL